MHLEQALARWKKSAQQAGTTKFRYARSIVRFVAGGIATTRAATRPRVAAFMATRREGGTAVATINLDLAALCVILRWLWVQGLFPLDRVQEIQALRMRRGPLAPPDCYSRDEFEHLRDVAWGLADWFGFAFEVACYTGVRRNELVRLEAEDVDYSRRLLHVRRKVAELGPVRGETKTRRERAVSLCPEAIALLRENAPPTGPLFQSRQRASTRFMLPDTFNRRMKELADLTGIPATYRKCRRFFTTGALLAGVPPTEVAAMLGHTGSGLTLMMDRYRAWLTAYEPSIERFSPRGLSA